MREGALKDWPPRYGPCVGHQDGAPVILCIDKLATSPVSLVQIDKRGVVVRKNPLDTSAIWKVVAGENGVFLAYGKVSNDLYDLNGAKLLSLRTTHQISTEADTVYENATLLPCGIIWTNYSRIEKSEKWKFVGAVVSVQKRFPTK